MIEKLNKIRKENPDFDKKLVDMFANNMPDLLNIIIDGYKYDCHIGSKDVAKLAEKYITDSKGNKIGFHWDYEELINQVKNIVDLEETEFYPADIWTWSNVKYGDMQHLADDRTIIKYAISELMDKDFPFYPASQRAYKWLKKHIESDENK